MKASQVEEADPRLLMQFEDGNASAGEIRARRERRRNKGRNNREHVNNRKKRAESRKDRKESRKDRTEIITRFRDNVRKVALGTNFVIIDVESQEELDYSYPLRDMGYVYGEYEKQAKQIRTKNRREDHISEAPKDEDDMRREPGEFLYHFRKEDRLMPTVVFLLYSGKEEWTAPLDFYGMLDLENIPSELREKIQNHRINLVDIHRMTEEQLSGFRSDVGKVFGLIRYSEEKEKLSELVTKDAYYENMPPDAYEVAANYIHAVELTKMEQYQTKEGGYRMCTAIRELIEDGRSEGRAEGRAEGVTMGRTEGMTMGKQRLLTEQACRKLRKHKTLEEIAEELEQNIEVIRAICEAAEGFAPDYDENSVFETYQKKCSQRLLKM